IAFGGGPQSAIVVWRAPEAGFAGAICFEEAMMRVQLAHGYKGLAALVVVGVLVVGAVGGVDGAGAQTPPTIAPALKDQYRRAPARPVENKALVELGRELFIDPQLSASGKTACVTCHLPQAAWSVLEARSTNDSGKLTSRKPQTLIGIGHATSPINGWDG